MALSDAPTLKSRAAPANPRRLGLAAIMPGSRYYWLRMLLQNPVVSASVTFIVLVCLIGVFAPVIAPADPEFVDPTVRLEGPSSEHLFGTDDLGRDVFSRAVYGARISLLVGITVMIGATALGSLIGLVAGFYRWLDTALMRVMDGLEAFPSILLAIAIMATFGSATR